MGLGERLAYGMDRIYDRIRDASVFRVRRQDATAGSFDQLRGEKYGLVISFRRNGDLMPSPVWMAVDDRGRIYIQTGARSGKVKRIRNDPSVIVAAANVRGKAHGPLLWGAARVLPREEWPHAEATLAGAFGLGRKLYGLAFPMGSDVVSYVEVTSAL